MASVVSWGVRLGGSDEMLIAIAPNATENDYERLVAVLEGAKIGVASYRAAVPVDGRSLRGTAIASADAMVTTVGDEA
jgi:hypothetical protein